MDYSIITEAFIQSYVRGITHDAQQKVSRLMGTSRVDRSIKGKKTAYDFIGTHELRERNIRHADSPQEDENLRRRWLTTRSYSNGTLIDDFDKIRVLNDPTNDLSQSYASGAGRLIDDVFIAAAFGTSFAGEEGTTQVTFPVVADANLIEADVGDTADTGMNIAKLRRVKRLMDQREVEDDNRFAVMSSIQFDDLLGTTEVTSADFNTVRALVNGEINQFLGFKFIRSERLLLDGSNNRRCLFYQKMGMQLGFGINPMGRIVPERADKEFSTYVYYRMDVGAVRLDEDRVWDVRCKEA